MSIRVITPDALTTVQDLGRSGYQAFGVPMSGAMDPRAMRLANTLCDSSEEEAVLEYTLLGPALKFTTDNVIALTGGDLGVTLDGQPLAPYGVYAVKGGQTFRFTVPETGCRAYLAFHGGLDIPPVMGSRSTHLKAKLGGFSGRKLEKGDELGFRAPMTAIPNLDVRRFTPELVPREVYTLRVVFGPQGDAFNEKGLRAFLSETYTVTPEFDRISCRLSGAAVTHKNGADTISDGIVSGTIQVPASGTPIITLADRQTTGGYMKIANVVNVSSRLLAQLKTNDKARFAEIFVVAAQDVECAERDALRIFAYAFERWDSILKIREEHYSIHTEDNTKLAPRRVRALVRDNKLIIATSALCPDYVKTNLLILSVAYADDFPRFVSWSPEACPVFEVIREKPLSSFPAPGVDLRTDLPRYRVFLSGKVSEEVHEVGALWNIGSIGSLLGYSASFDGAPLTVGLPVYHVEERRTMPIYQTKLRICLAGPSRGPVLVPTCPLPQAIVGKAYQPTEPVELIHGAPTQIDAPEEIGIVDSNKPDLGEVASIRDGETSVLRSSLATVQAALRFAKLPLAITDVPGYPLISNVRNDALLELFQKGKARA